jgi:flagellar basal-body rod protein FlgC
MILIDKIGSMLRSAISAHNVKERIAAQNLVNKDTLGPNKDSNPYTREVVVFNTDKDGFMSAKVVKSNNPYKLELDPSHPFADERGFVKKPRIDNFIEVGDSNDASFMKNTLFKICGELQRRLKKVYDVLIGG